MLKFKGYCTEHKIPQSEIADLLGISRHAVNRKMNGHEPWTLEQVKKLTTAYNISAEFYFI